MGAFNTVRTTTVCHQCHATVQISVQFKYGDTWQHEYKLGDRLRWGGNDIGTAGKHSVVIDGVAESPCPKCGRDSEWSFYIFTEDDTLVRVTSAGGEHDFLAAGETYIILKE